MGVASDLAAVLSDPFLTVRWTVGSVSGRGSLVKRDAVRPDDLQGTVLVRETVLRVPVAQLTTLAIGDAITIDRTAFVVRDVRIGGGGALREVVVA